MATLKAEKAVITPPEIAHGATPVTTLPLIVHDVSLGENPLPARNTSAVPAGPELGVRAMLGDDAVTVNMAMALSPAGLPVTVIV